MALTYTDDLLKLALRCDRGAAELLREAANAAEVLATRAYGDQTDPQEWAARKHAAAAAATRYAEGLRAEAAELQATHARPSAERVAQAERVATAAELGGILVDGRRMAERNANSELNQAWDEGAARRAWDEGSHESQRKADEVTATGAFEYVAETIGGIEQVPFWRLAAGDGQHTEGSASAAAEGKTSMNKTDEEAAVATQENWGVKQDQASGDPQLVEVAPGVWEAPGAGNFEVCLPIAQAAEATADADDDADGM